MNSTLINIDLPNELKNTMYPNFPFDCLKISGKETIDFFQRISTNNFSQFTEVQKTLLITEKGRIIDAVWIIKQEQFFFMLCSKGMAEENIAWLNKFIIMEDIVLENISSTISVHLVFTEHTATDYFGLPVNFLINTQPNEEYKTLTERKFEELRIELGIPKIQHEIRQEFNPLELNLWNFISFTKGCYIGQEVIARLEAYDKIQRSLCLFSSTNDIEQNSLVIDSTGNPIGMVTSTLKNSETHGLAVIKKKFLENQQQFQIENSNGKITIKKVFSQAMYGRN